MSLLASHRITSPSHWILNAIFCKGMTKPMTERLPEGCIKRIHVNQNLLRRAMAGEDVCPYTVQFKGKAHPCKRWTASGVLEGVNAIHKPLSCGARLYVQTTGPMVLYQ